MRRPFFAGRLAGAALGVVYGGWLVHAIMLGVPGSVRAAAALAAAGMVVWRDREGGLFAGSRAVTWVPFIIAAYPIETLLPTSLDAALQQATAVAAAALLQVGGVSVSVAPGAPVITGQSHVLVQVTALCAGSQTLVAMTTLGLVLAELFFQSLRDKLAFVLLAPLFGFLGNIVRVALSTRAADAWGTEPQAWSLAHDGIGYATFVLTYGALFGCIWVARRHATRQTLPQPTNQSPSAGRSVQSPSHTKGVFVSP